MTAITISATATGPNCLVFSGLSSALLSVVFPIPFIIMLGLDLDNRLIFVT